MSLRSVDGAQAGVAPVSDGPTGGSSRRRRLWELPRNAFCPVLGTCIPIDQLRRLADKVLGGRVQADDYALHSGAVDECSRRGDLSERFQRDLDQRYAIELQRARQIRSTEALSEHWARATRGSEVGAALWVTLTHPRCDAALEERVLRDIHMLQHQIGIGTRAEAQHLQDLAHENGVLTRELAAAQQRVTRLLAGKTAQIERQQSELVRLRAQLITRETLVSSLRDELAQLEQQIPSLRSRVELGRRLEAQQERVHDLERHLMRSQQRVHQLEERLEREAVEPQPPAAQAQRVIPLVAAVDLRDKAVLCVGGKAAIVPVYRRLVETSGARFMHHDGGEEDNAAQLECHLASADLVICQAGCISHGAYWRVKDHCKRTGKRCVFVDRPSASGLARGLETLSGGLATAPACDD
ncbi:DUF2325 domain-containing protein [Sphaerotilus hippei]|nr:DUF2325 domain-containing protein [Sphaerotilus hippei]